MSMKPVFLLLSLASFALGDIVLVPLFTRTFYLIVSGRLHDSLFMETKAYCVQKGLLQPEYLSMGLFQELRKGSEDGPLANMTILNGLAVMKDSLDSEIWQNYSYLGDMNARMNVTFNDHTFKVNPGVYLEDDDLLWDFVNDGQITKNDYNAWITKRAMDLSSDPHKIFIPALDKLFLKKKLSRGLFTNEIEDFVKKAKPGVNPALIFEFASNATVIGCAEEPRPSSPRIVLALTLDIFSALLPEHVFDEFLSSENSACRQKPIRLPVIHSIQYLSCRRTVPTFKMRLLRVFLVSTIVLLHHAPVDANSTPPSPGAGQPPNDYSKEHAAIKQEIVDLVTKFGEDGEKGKKLIWTCQPVCDTTSSFASCCEYFGYGGYGTGEPECRTREVAYCTAKP